MNGTYSAVRFSNETRTALIKYIEDNRIPNALGPDELHTTLLYSRRYCPKYKARGKIDPPLVAGFLGFDVFENDGAPCLVLKLDSPELEERHRQLMNEHQATYDFPQYIPHVSLSYDIASFDVSSLPPYAGRIQIVEEYSETLIF